MSDTPGDCSVAHALPRKKAVYAGIFTQSLTVFNIGDKLGD